MCGWCAPIARVRNLGSFLPNLDYLSDFDRAEESHADFLDLYNVSDDEVPLLLWTSGEGPVKGTSMAPFSVIPESFIKGRRRARRKSR